VREIVKEVSGYVLYHKTPEGSGKSKVHIRKLRKSEQTNSDPPPRNRPLDSMSFGKNKRPRLEEEEVLQNERIDG